MAIIEIRDVLDNETGQTIFPRTHVNAVIGLKDTNFFEAVDDGNGGFSVKLKSEYQGLWAEGWISSGGINSQGGGGGGGGLIQTVYTWNDMQEMSSSPEDDTTSAFNAKTVYEIYKLLRSDGGGYLKDSSGGFFLTSSSEKILLKGAGHSLSSLSDVSIYNPSVNDLLVWSGYSWVNVPQSSVRPDLSGYVTQVAFDAAVASLQAEIAAITSFFEEDASHNITLKSPYQNLWVPGWLAAGGIGTSGGGGGGVSYLKELSDVYHTSNSNVLRADGTPVNPGDALVYNSTLGWVAAPVSGGGGGGTITDVTLGGTSVVSGTIAALPAYPSSLSQLSDDSAHRLVTDTQISTWNGLSSRITDIEGWFEVVNVAASGETPVYALHAKNNYAIYSDSWISSGGAGSGSSSGGDGVQKIKVWNTTVTPNASTGVADITSATSTLIMSSIAEYVNISQILTSGTAIATVQIGTGAAFNLYAPSGGGGGGTLSSVGLEMPTGFSVSGSPLQSNGNITVSFANGYKLPTTAKQGNWDTAFSWGDHSLAGYVTQTGVQEISGAKTFKTSDVTLQGINLVPSTNNTCGIGTSSARFASIYGTNADLSGNLSMGANSYIDIGNARIIYDSGAKALHIQGKTGVNDAIGLFADGEVSSGGVAAQSTVSFVTLSGNQSVDGEKIFTGRIVFSGTNLGDASYGIDAQCDSKFTNILATGNATISTRMGVGGAPNNSYALYVTGSQSMTGSLTVGSSATITSGLGVGTAWAGNSNKLVVSGTAVASAWNTSSDIRLKDNISPIEGAIDLVMALKPSKWVWNAVDMKGKVGVGLIAQDVEAVAPWMVESGEYKSLNYQMLHAYELSALQDHEMRIRELEKVIA